MNRLIVGTDKSDILHHLPDSYLFIDDEVDVPVPKRKTVVRFDVNEHSFNPLKDIDYRRAREFISVLDAVFPEGANTLTKKTSNFVLLNALLAKPKFLDKLISKPRGKDTGALDAYQKIETLLLSPVLERVLCNRTNFPLDGIILARLNRAELGDFDCFVLANLLISQYKGHVVIPDFGFYACTFHTSLIRQNRLTAGVNYLDETPFRERLLMIKDKDGKHCTAEDAGVLAEYAGLIPHENQYNEFIARRVA